MNQTPRERARIQTMQDIIRIGRGQLALHGAAALSLRAVARDLGIVSSAVYRYVKNRDDLLTLLVVDGYDELGDEIDLRLAAVSAGDFREQFRTLARAVRTWAMREPARYALLFGSPVPGYEAPAERTSGPGTRVVSRLIGILEGAHVAGKLRPADSEKAPRLTPGLAADLYAIRAERALTLPDEILADGVLIWASLFGAVNFEVFGQYGMATFAEPAELFEHHLAVLEAVIGLVDA